MQNETPIGRVDACVALFIALTFILLNLYL